MKLKIAQRGRIAVLQLFGTLGTSQRSEEIVPLLEALRRSKMVRAVVLDIDSPGGEVTASTYLHLAVQKLAAEKPVIAFVRGTCASGAYLVSCAAQKIVALPYAIIGSIGVISAWPVVSELMEKLGVRMEVSKSADLKDQHAFWRPPTDEERQRAQALVDDFHKEFVTIVSQARRLDSGAVEALATGEVFWARRAQQMGMVDELGDQERAIELAMELGQVPRRLVLVKPRMRFWQRLLGRLSGQAAQAIVMSVEEQLRPRVWM